MSRLALPQQDVPQILALEEGLPFEEVEQRIGLAYAAAGLKHRVVAFYLRDLDARGLEQLGGCCTTAQYAAHRFGMSRREARDLLAAGKALVDLPEIDRAFAEGRLCWSKVRELIKVATAQHEQKWLETALRLHTDELALEVKLSRQGDPPRQRDDRKGLPEVRLRMNTAMPADVFAMWEQVRHKLGSESGKPLREWECLEAVFKRELARTTEEDGSGACDSPYAVVVRTATDDEEATVETEDGPVPIDPVTAEMIACDAGVIDPQLDDHEADRRVSPSRRRRVYARDRHRCRHCVSPHRLHLHHIIPWSKGGRSRVLNLITLCRTCHALVHAGLLLLVGDAKSCRFENCNQQDLHGPGTAPAEFLPDPPPLINVTSPRPPTPLVRLQDIPARIDQAWWRRHAHLLRWVGSRGTYELQPGQPISLEGAHGSTPSDTACPTRIGTVCQPRPSRLDEVIGQNAVVRALQTAVGAARMTGEAANHTLLAGPPGLGKTTLARAVASELGVRLHTAAGPFVRNTEALVKLMVGLGQRDVLFIDEVHALAPGVAEGVYEAIEDQQVSLLVSSGAMARSITLDLPPFTMIGATTDAGLLPEAFLSRFVYWQFLEFYEARELAVILGRAAPHFGIEIEPEAAGELAEVSRGTPRRGIALLRQLRNEAIVGNRPVIDVAHVARTLDRLGIDGQGLVPLDRQYLNILRSRKRAVGLGQLARQLGVDAPTLEREHEPYLIHLGLIAITPQGRLALDAAA
ncbi:MAG: Holliday junction branch migration DNA helicase RuvB [Planctomycetota bacterium]|jgi:Holliday junction DNA helicase RuvB